MIMNQEEYKNLRDMHTKALGDTFEKAFEGNEDFNGGSPLSFQTRL